MINGKGTEASFDLFNMISGYCTSGTLASCKGQEWSYVYTADDERVAAYRANTGSGVQKVFTIRDLGNRLLMRDEQRHDFVYNHLVEDYVWRGDRLLGARQYSLGTMRHFGLDHLGTIRLTTDGSGNVSGADTYRPFGVEATTSVDDEPMRFTGHERDLQTTSSDPEDDVDYMHARFYGPGVGRFMSSDPAPAGAGQPTSWNRYSYVSGNPLRFTDPTGLWKLVSLGEIDAIGTTTGFGQLGPVKAGTDLSFGQILINTDDPLDVGWFAAVGPAAGTAEGAAVGVGIILRDLDGEAVNTDFNYGRWSFTVSSDYQGPNGFFVTAGVGGKGVVVSATETADYTLRDAINITSEKLNAMEKGLEALWNRLFGDSFESAFEMEETQP